MSDLSVSEPFCLSENGSTRASAYTMTNKSVRIGDVTHVTWLDRVSGIRVRSYDHRRGEWSPTVEIDEGCDNHGNPSLAAAPDGRLRMSYGPHGFGNPRGDTPWRSGRFAVKQSDAPGDVTGWHDLSCTGYGATYACLVTDSQGRDHLVYRGEQAPTDARGT